MQIGGNIKVISTALNMSEQEVIDILNEIEKSPFRLFYEEKDGYYSGYILEAIKYYKIIKNQKKAI